MQPNQAAKTTTRARTHTQNTVNRKIEGSGQSGDYFCGRPDFFKEATPQGSKQNPHLKWNCESGERFIDQSEHQSLDHWHFADCQLNEHSCGRLYTSAILTDVLLLCYQLTCSWSCSTGADPCLSFSHLSYHQLQPVTGVGQLLQMITLSESPLPLLAVTINSGIECLGLVGFVPSACVGEEKGSSTAYSRLEEYYQGGLPEPTWKGPHFTLWLSDSCLPCWLEISLQKKSLARGREGIRRVKGGERGFSDSNITKK